MEIPRLDETQCSACSRCVAICPVDCLVMAGGIPWLPRPADCVACGACVLLCPEEALQIVSIDLA